VIAGVGNAASAVLMLPLLADLVPRHHMGVATGVLAASGSLAAPLTSLLAGRLADLYGPRAIFGFMALMIVLALSLMLAVQTPKADEPRVAEEPSAGARAA
jgi:MFS family permease